MSDKVHDANTRSRRGFLKGLATASAGAVGGVSLSEMFDEPTPHQIEHVTQYVNRNSRPSDLRITDLRIATIDDSPFRVPLLRIDTNQGISGFGEVRDGGDESYALMLKSRLLGQNPCNVEKLFGMIRQFGDNGRLGGGVSGVDMALWDLAGKAYGVPVYQLLGGKYRDHIRLYTDTETSQDPDEYAANMQHRVDMGFTFLKMDLGIELIQHIPGALTGAGYWGNLEQYNTDPNSYGATPHPFTQIQITDKGMDAIANYVETIRERVGYDLPLAADHFGHFGVETAIRLGQRLDRYNMAWLEDMVPWMYRDQIKQISSAVTTPIATGEDIYTVERFKPLIDEKTVDLVHPDIGTAGGILQTKKIGDYATDNGVPFALHFAGSPIGAVASAHVAAASKGFVALESHSTDVEWWEQLVHYPVQPLRQHGFYQITDAPGLGVELNEDVIKQHLGQGARYFPPTPEWDHQDTSHDRNWS